MGKGCRILPNCPYLLNCLHPGATAGHSFYVIAWTLSGHALGLLARTLSPVSNSALPLLSRSGFHLSSIVPAGGAAIILGGPH